MKALDVMTSKVVTVSPETSISEIAKLFLRHRISAVPVADGDRRVLGMVSEGDLLHRAETETESKRPWWLAMIAGTEEQARDYVKSHGQRAGDVMSTKLVTVAEDAPLAEIAQLLEERRIKRVPVTRNGKLVGIVSRADLVRALASRSETAPATSSSPSDQAIREDLLRTLESNGWIRPNEVTVIVTDGVIHMWGAVESDEIRQAVRVAAENVSGARSVESHIGLVPPWAFVD